MLSLVFGLSAAPLVASAADDDSFELENRTGKSIKLRKLEAQENARTKELEQLAQAKRRESMERLKGLLNRNPEGETKAEMMLRLAELYYEEGRYLYLQEMADYDRRQGECFNTEGCALESVVAQNDGSHAWQGRAVQLYQGILRNYPQYNRADQATFFLGSALNDLDRKKESVNAFRTLVKRYPDSQWVPDAYVLIGEYFFEEEANAFKALQAYSRAAQFTDSPKYSYAMYKLGWSYYNVGDYKKAIETMKAVVDYSLQQEQSMTSMQLQDEALKDLVRFFADADQMEEAIDFFTRMGRNDLIRVTLRKLASTFFEQGKFERAIDMYRRLILDDATAVDNPGYQVDIINAYKKMGERGKVLDEVQVLRTKFGAESAWAQANRANEDAVKDANGQVEMQLRRIAVDYHNTGRKYKEQRRMNDANELYGLARTAYDVYLELFPSNEHTYDVRFGYGELMYELKDFAGAYTQYMAVVDLNPQGQHSRFCAESAVFAAEEQVKAEGGAIQQGTRTRKISKEVQPEPLTEWEQRFVDACLKYAELYKGDKRVKDMIYKSAYLLYNKFQFDQAATQFRAVISMNPASQEAEYSAQLILDALVVKENWEALRETAKVFYDTERLGKKAFKTDAYNIYENASFKLIEVTLEQDKDYSKAADSFFAFYQEFRDTATLEKTAKAVNNAAFYYTKTGQVVNSVKMREILVEDEKYADKTKYYYEQVGLLGFDYERIADYEKSAGYYERLWGLYQKRVEKKEKLDEKISQTAGDAIYSAAVFRKGLGNWQQSISNYNSFVKAYPSDERVADVRLRVANIYEEQEQWPDAATAFQGYYAKPPKGAPIEFIYFARLHHGQALYKLDDLKGRDAVYGETIKLYRKYVAGGGEKGPQTEYVAEMLYTAALPELNEYTAKGIRSLKKVSKKREDEALKKSLADKTKSYLEVEKRFQEVVELGAGRWGIAALVALGRVYDNMAESLRTSDVPSYLTDDQAEFYMMKIEDRAYLQEEKAIEAFRVAIDKSFNLTLYNDDTAFANRRLGELRPDDYPGLYEHMLDPRWTSSRSGKQFDFETSL